MQHYCQFAVILNISILLLVPTSYAVSVIAHHVQIVGQSLTLECSVTTVRGITSKVAFAWSTGELVLKNVEQPKRNLDTPNFDIYTDTYIISPVSVKDDGRTYQCEAVINENLPLTASGNVTLDVTGTN